MSDLLQYRTEHLFLLVGTNPLPNYVAAKLLLEDGGTLHLLYSDETHRIAERLRQHLGGKVCLQRVNPTDAEDIIRKTRRQLRGITGTVGLHYTGGTKAMAVHAYRAVEQAFPEAIFSYLDAETFSMRFDPDWSEEVLFSVKPTLKDLTALHGVPLRENSPQREADLWGLETATALAHSFARHGPAPWQDWLQIFGEQLCSATPMAVTLPHDPRLREVSEALRRDLSLETGTTVIAPEVITTLKSKTKWFNGEWLEHYVLTQLLSIRAEAQVHDCAMSLPTVQGGHRADFDFEFDVAALRGYQFFGISCATTKHKGKAKRKLFEAYIRARQLGGDEARAALVCANEKAHRFEREVIQKWRAQDKIKVFGPREWPELAAYLKAWLETAQ
jgi:hypothetical protein